MGSHHWRRGRRSTVLVAAALSGSLLISPATTVASDPLPVGQHHETTSAERAAPVDTVAVQTLSQFGIGDVFVGVGSGLVQWRLPDGTLNATLDTGVGGFTTGMAFDKLGNLYSTAFTANTIVKFDTSGTKIGTFES
jgi:hypothetical protein